MNDKKSTEEAQAQRYADALKNFLNSYLHPAFGALPKAEVELLILQMMEEIGEISPQPSIYELVSKLKITSSKARKLIYERDLRRKTPEDLDVQLLSVLQKPIILKDGELFVLQIENSLLSDYLREKVKLLGHVTDGSFSPGLVKLSLEAMAALIDNMFEKMDKEKKENARKALIASGAPDTSFKGLVKAVLKRVGSKIASESGEVLMDEASRYLEPILTGASAGITKSFKGFFADAVPKKGK